MFVYQADECYSMCMPASNIWDDITVPVAAPDGWTRPEIRHGLAQLERIARGLDYARAVLISGLGVDGRDTAAEIARATGMSTRTATQHRQVATVIKNVAGAGDLLASGSVSSEHLRSLMRIDDADDATELLGLAVVQSPEDFRLTIDRFLFDRDEAGARERQHAARSVRFFNAEIGCVGIRSVLTPLEGAELRSRLLQIADATWRKEHPERAETLGGHGGPPLHQRLADAFMNLVRGEAGLSSRPSVVVVVHEETLTAEIAGTGPGSGPISIVDAVGLLDRADLYAAVKSMTGVILNFGRSRRFASPLQRLAVIVRDRGQCAVPGCDASHERCHVHHRLDVEKGGLTNLADLALLCTAHHTYLHANNLHLVREGGGWIVEPDIELRDTG